MSSRRARPALSGTTASSPRTATPRRASMRPQRELPSYEADDERGARRAKLDDVAEAARKIAGCEPPPWFTENLLHAAVLGLRECHKIDKAYVPVTKMRLRLKTIRDAAELLFDELHRFEVIGLLPLLEGCEYLNETVQTLKEIKECAATQVEALPTSRGRKTIAAVFEVQSTTVVCASLVVEAWTLMRGKPPGVGNPQAAEAAEALWRATGGPDRERGDGSDGTVTARWRRPFQDALRLKEPDRARLRDHLSHGRPPNQVQNSSKR